MLYILLYILLHTYIYMCYIYIYVCAIYAMIYAIIYSQYVNINPHAVKHCSVQSLADSSSSRGAVLQLARFTGLRAVCRQRATYLQRPCQLARLAELSALASHRSWHPDLHQAQQRDHMICSDHLTCIQAHSQPANQTFPLHPLKYTQISNSYQQECLESEAQLGPTGVPRH